MNFNKILTAGATLLALVSFRSERAAAQDTLMTMSRASLLVPRTALQPVKSIDKSSAYPIDTLDTGNPAVKILLLEDYTWKYYKDPSVAASAQVYKDYWNEELPNPYRLDTKDLQDDISLWVVDTLSEYHCPYQTKVYSPFGYRHGRRHMGVDKPQYLVSKCRCAPVERPVEPPRPMVCPAVTQSPGETRRLDRCA